MRMEVGVGVRKADGDVVWVWGTPNGMSMEGQNLRL
jgi:hypothetical protein